MALACGIVLVLVSESQATADSADGFSYTARQERMQLRPIFQANSSFPPNTLAYFVDPPFATYVISGMMFLRYGPNVTVAGNDYEAYANLRQSAFAIVFYPDEEGNLREQAVDRAAAATADPALPVQFGPYILLEGFEVVNTRANIGQALILILYWRALGQVDRNYTVFAHLLDASGTMIAGSDSQPHRGNWPTSLWEPGHLVEDAVVIPITSDVPSGSRYRVEVGMYYLPTMERLSILKENQNVGRDAVDFDAFGVEP